LGDCDDQIQARFPSLRFSNRKARLCLTNPLLARSPLGELPPELPPLVAPGALDNPWAVRRSLKRIFGEAASGRMDPLTARVLAHLGRLPLFSTRRPRRKRRAC